MRKQFSYSLSDDDKGNCAKQHGQGYTDFIGCVKPRPCAYINIQIFLVMAGICLAQRRLVE